jgi:hypothetical protein
MLLNRLVEEDRALREPRRAHCRTRPFFWPMRASSWNQISIRVSVGRSFFKSLDDFGVLTGMARARAHMGKAQLLEQRSDIALVITRLQDEISPRYEMTSIDDVREALQASAGVKIMILDACRDNPLAERLSRSIAAKTREIPVVQGFSPVAPDDGMLVEYSTQPNQVASDGTSRNSPFTTALLAHLKEPGLEIGTMFRHVGNHVYKATNGSQSPELSISLHSDYFLNQSESDAQAWAKAQTSDDPSRQRH